MPLFLGTKRTHEQSSSDQEDHEQTQDDKAPTPSSSSVPTPNTSRQTITPANSQRRKMARYSMPSDSPTNLFRIDNDTFFQNLPIDADSLPIPVKTHLELRFQLKHFKVSRFVQVPTNYTFKNIHNLIQFLFGWKNKHAHKFRLAKEVKTYSGTYKDGEIKSNRAWVDLYDENALDGALLAYEKDRLGKQGEDKQSQEVIEKIRSLIPEYPPHDPEKVDAEAKWTVEKLWGSGGVFTERGVIYEYDMTSPWTVEITLKSAVALEKPSNDIHVIRGKGAPPQEDPEPSGQTGYPDEDPERKTFLKEQCNDGAFAKILKGELVTYLGDKEFSVCTRREAARKEKEQRARGRRNRTEAARGRRAKVRQEEEDTETEPEGDV